MSILKFTECLNLKPGELETEIKKAFPQVAQARYLLDVPLDKPGEKQLKLAFVDAGPKEADLLALIKRLSVPAPTKSEPKVDHILSKQEIENIGSDMVSMANLPGLVDLYNFLRKLMDLISALLSRNNEAVNKAIDELAADVDRKILNLSKDLDDRVVAVKSLIQQSHALIEKTKSDLAEKLDKSATETHIFVTNTVNSTKQKADDDYRLLLSKIEQLEQKTASTLAKIAELERSSVVISALATAISSGLGETVSRVSQVKDGAKK